MSILVQDEVRPIPRDVALRLCAEIRRENKGRLIDSGAMQCWGCIRFAGGDPEKMRVSEQPGYRGCSLVNARFDRRARLDE